MALNRRIITKGSKCGTFQKGDHINICEDGRIECIEGHGWIDSEDVSQTTIGMETESDKEYIKNKIKILNESLGKLTLIND